MPDDGLSNGDWAEHRRLILFRFDHLDREMDDLRKEIKELRHELLAIKLRVAAIGGASGLVGWLLPYLLTK